MRGPHTLPGLPREAVYGPRRCACHSGTLGDLGGAARYSVRSRQGSKHAFAKALTSDEWAPAQSDDSGTAGPASRTLEPAATPSGEPAIPASSPASRTGWPTI